jgi:hypothetical protein
MIVGQQKPLFPLCSYHGFELRLVELDDLLLFAMNPTRENHQYKLPGLQDEADRQPVGESDRQMTHGLALEGARQDLSVFEWLNGEGVRPRGVGLSRLGEECGGRNRPQCILSDRP